MCFASVTREGDVLTSAFDRLHERESWAGKLSPGGKHFVTRNQSSIIAFTIPPADATKTGKPLGISVVGAHTDSPRFVVKPVSKREKAGYAQIGVETYGGGLWVREAVSATLSSR